MPYSRHLPRDRLSSLLDVLSAEGYECVGPQVRDGAIVYDTLESVDRLPLGVRDAQAPGEYRLQDAPSPRRFAWANGPMALKPLMFTTRETLWTVARDADGRLAFQPVVPQPQPLAVIGVRGCDLAALRLQDAHFMHGAHPDPHYTARRQSLFLVAVNCAHPADTCFCVSTGDGPRAQADYDLVLSELDEGYLIESGSDAGEAVLQRLDTESATGEQTEQAAREIEAAAARQTRGLPSRNLEQPLFERLDHPRWDDVAGRCLSCGNCTSVCPTCFCYSEHDAPALEGGHSEHYRQWDSCFTHGHSYIHGSLVRAETRQRYRQWLTHKLGSWHSQYGRSGCVGCGRCITWCPVGIDITEEAQAICGDVSDQ